jgi:hypothetical protein
VDALEQAHAQFLAAVDRLPSSKLDEVTADERDPALGSGVPYAVLLHGLSQHYAYHAGRVAMLRKALG